jgi:hypothetical protein
MAKISKDTWRKAASMDIRDYQEVQNYSNLMEMDTHRTKARKGTV